MRPSSWESQAQQYSLSLDTEPRSEFEPMANTKDDSDATDTLLEPPEGFDHLLWSWPLEYAQRPNKFPEEVRDELTHHKLIFSDAIGFQQPLTAARLARGESLEELRGDGKLAHRRELFCFELTELKKRRRDVRTICEVLGEAKYRALWAVSARIGFGLARDACKQDLKNLTKLQRLLEKRILPSNIWPLFVTDLEFFKVVAFAQWLDAPKARLDDLIDVVHREKGRPRKGWRKDALKRLRALRVSEETSEELFRIVGLMPLDERGTDLAAT